MDHFEIVSGMTPDEKRRLAAALAILQQGIEQLSTQFDLCPVCLVYALADLTADKEEQGLVQHMGETEH